MTPKPFIDVALDPTVSIDTGPVVDVTMNPRIARLPTLAEMQARRRAKQKPSTRLSRAIAHQAMLRLDVRNLETWARAVKTRDRWTDQKTGERVRSTRALDPLRAEAHHIEPRSNWAVRYDVRNGICLSFATHFAVENYELRIEGTAWFEVEGCRYIDGTYPVTFVRL